MFIKEPKVVLLNHTPEPEKMITAAAKLCYSNTVPTKLYDDLTEEQIKKFLNMIMKMGHGSILEHVVFNFAIEDISRVTETQLVRHRMASPSIQSGRYVKRDPHYVVPGDILNDPELLDIYATECENASIAYRLLTYNLQKKYTMEKLGLTLEEFTILECIDSENQESKEFNKTFKLMEKKAIENARYILPQSLRTHAVYSIDLRNLIGLIGKRKCKRAQEEIQMVAQGMYDAVAPLIPTIIKYVGAPCELGGCPEGSMTCGKPFDKKK